MFDEVVYGASAAFVLWIPPHAQERFVADLAALSAGSLSPTFGISRVIDVPAD